MPDLHMNDSASGEIEAATANQLAQRITSGAMDVQSPEASVAESNKLYVLELFSDLMSTTCTNQHVSGA